MTFAHPLPPIAIEHVLSNPGEVHTLIANGSPYYSVQRYVESLDQLRALSEAGQDDRRAPHKPMLVAPWFRGDWCVPGRPHVPGVARFLEHPAFHSAAQQLFGAAVVRPEHVYVNLNPPLPKVDPGHVDVPCFRGATRARLPVWLLQVMHKSELFAAWYVPTATAVSWFYAGQGGGFTYWPDGPDAPPRSRPCMSNTALMGDNDHMFHAVEAVGGSDREVPMGLTLDATLRALHGEPAAPAMPSAQLAPPLPAPRRSDGTALALGTSAGAAAGAAAGAKAGALIDLGTGGLTLGAGTALGALLGGTTAWVVRSLQKKDAGRQDLLQHAAEAACSHYLAIAHQQRMPPDAAHPWAARWHAEVTGTVAAHGTALAAALQDGADAEALAPLLRTVLMGILQRSGAAEGAGAAPAGPLVG